jgi:RNA polymerase sigma-70 factor, ECF subfamily
VILLRAVRSATEPLKSGKVGSGKEGILEEEALLSGAKAGNQTAYRHLVEKYQGVVAATAIGMLGRCPDAEDIGQQVFLNFFNSLDKFRGEAALGTYLTRIAINLCLNELKKRKRRARWMFWSQASYPESAAPSSEDLLESDERKEQVRQAVLRLSPEYRAVIVLRWMEERSTVETAEILGIPIGTVLSRLHRSQSQLKEILAPWKGASS